MTGPEPLEPFDPEVTSLLADEKATRPSPEALGRMRARVVGGPTPSGDGDGGAPTGEGPSAARSLMQRTGTIATMTFVIGAVLGAGAHSLLQPPTPGRIVYVERAAAGTADPTVQSSTVVPPATGLPPQASGSTSAVRSAPTQAPSSLSVERTLLEDARSALATGDAGRALRLTDEHARRFPRGQLNEEREAIAIQSLVVLGKYAEARARAARFRAIAPQSLFLSAIDAALASIP